MNEDEGKAIEDVNQTDSQKSIATSFMYSLDFTDSNSDKQNSSGMDTYILECDSETSDSPRSKYNAIIKEKSKRLHINKDIQCYEYSLSKCSIIAQETYTQTSKTIIELARNEGAVLKSAEYNTLETQTSKMSITGNKTVTYRIESGEVNENLSNNDFQDIEIACNQLLNRSLEDFSSKYLSSANSSLSDRVIEINNEEIIEATSEEENDDTSNNGFENTSDNSDMEQDSLMEPCKQISDNSTKSDEEIKTPKSVDRDIAELYTKLYESIEFQSHRPFKQNAPDVGYLTPLPEEAVAMKATTTSYASDKAAHAPEEDQDVLFTNTAGIKVKIFPQEKAAEIMKLPPIQGTRSTSKNANLDFLFSVNPNKLQQRSKALPCVFEERKDDKSDRWELASGARELASGEGSFVNGRNDADRVTLGTVVLPPIHIVSSTAENQRNKPDELKPESTVSELEGSITIKDKIRELKMSHKGKNWCHTKFSMCKSDSRSVSPSAETEDSRTLVPAERSCELICLELLKRLRSNSWLDIVDALEDITRSLDKFWNVITEYRIADLLRQVTAFVESPRTQVARTACNTLAIILKHTNYTKKPEFYEAMTILLTKTGSFSRPVRRAANVALDDIVCGVELSHAVTAICIHGATHKSALVRCASARLLVVCCALGGGGRDLLRARPPTAAAARRHVLRALATLLEDKSCETRQYAERLYSMLRPITSFEAYYISDLDIELASRQLKKYDQLLMSKVQGSR